MSTTRSTRMGSVAALLIGAAVAFGACSGSAATPPPATTGPAASQAASQGAGQATPASQGGTGGVSGAVSALSNVTSYKFSMTMKGGSFGDLFDKPVSGTVVMTPTPAVEITYSAMGMDMKVMQVGDKVYTNVLGTWTLSDKDSDKSMIDTMSPAKMFGSYFDSSVAAGYKAAGEEQKNGVATIHYVGDASMMSEYGSMLGVTGGTWSAEVWIAKTGGYPVSTKIESKGGSAAFLLQLDVTNVNDPANVVKAPSL